MTLKFTFLIIFVLAVEPAYSYLDPGAGSMLAQLVMGGVAGVLVIFKLYWNKLKGLITRTDSRHDNDDNSQKD